MSDVRALVADALQARFGISALGHRSITEFVDALLSLPGIAIVETAAPVEHDEHHWVVEDVGDVTVSSHAGVRLINIGFDLTANATEARILAAALLAAADVAEPTA